jgi:hypothetical protein
MTASLDEVFRYTRSFKNINLKISLYIDDTRSAPRDGSLLPLKEKRHGDHKPFGGGDKYGEKVRYQKVGSIFGRRHHKTKIGGASLDFAQ